MTKEEYLDIYLDEDQTGLYQRLMDAEIVSKQNKAVAKEGHVEGGELAQIKLMQAEGEHYARNMQPTDLMRERNDAVEKNK
jgi:hypothetical protein